MHTPVGTFPPALPSPLDRGLIRLAFLESQFATVPLGAVVALGVWRLNIPQSKQMACRRSRLIMGDAGLEDRISDPGAAVGREPAGA